MKYALVNCDIYTGESVLYDKGIVVNEDKIESLVNMENIPASLDTVDLKGANIAPGFIDLQVNGGGGLLFNDNPTEATIAAIFAAHKRFGTLNFLPTLITADLGTMLQAIKTVDFCTRDNRYGILGIHLEGPYINSTKAGVHDKHIIRPVTEDELATILSAGKSVIKIITTAPEVMKPEYIQMIRKDGIVVSAGHSNATYEQAIKAFDNGVSFVTHLFNAMSQFGSREPGLVGAAFDSEDTWSGIIVDGLHVHFASVRISVNLKPGKMVLVTDAMPPVGSKIERFILGDLEIFCSNGQCTTRDGVLAGSMLDMATAVRNCVQKVGIPLDESLRMASTYPAQVIGLGEILGKIKPGYIANMVIFNNQLHVEGVVSYGQREQFV